MAKSKRKCKVCGATVTNMNPLTTTCDPICTRARNNNVSRYDQILRDIADEEREYGEANYTTPNTKEKEGGPLGGEDYGYGVPYWDGLRYPDGSR